MGFYIRKSVRFGPIRFNLSKSGVGISSGIRGARISTGPRGTYIHMGANGLYYRRRIDSSVHSGSSGPRSYVDTDFDATDVDSHRIADTLVDSTSNELLEGINSRIQHPSRASWVGVTSTAIALLIAVLSLFAFALASRVVGLVFVTLFLTPLIVAGVVWGTGLSVAWVTRQQETLARKTTLEYTLDAEATTKFADLENAFAALTKSAVMWLETSSVRGSDWKRSAGASSLITRKAQ